MKKVLLLCLAATSAFAFKPAETHPQALHVGVHSASVSGVTCHGLSLNYEKVAASTVYAGADFGVIANDWQTVGRLEGRVGYTPAKIGDLMISPFVSIGAFSRNPTMGARDDYSSYGIGCAASVGSNQYFSMGVAVQGMQMQSFKNTSDEKFYAWEASYVVRLFPETMDLEFRPYFTRLNNIAGEKHFGVKTSVGYAF